MSERTVVVRKLETGVTTLDASASHHVRDVLRLAPGARLRLVSPAEALVAHGTITALSPLVTIEVEQIAPGERERRRVVWVQGLPKGDKADAIVQDATELGATDIVFAEMDRCVRVLDDARKEKTLARWQRIAEGALVQCGRTDMPSICGPLPLQEALERVPAGHRFVLFEKATAPLREDLLAALAGEDPIVFVVGPEGGITDGEAERATQLGFLARSFGRVILRTETMAAAALGAVRAWDL